MSVFKLALKIDMLFKCYRPCFVMLNGKIDNYLPRKLINDCSRVFVFILFFMCILL